MAGYLTINGEQQGGSGDGAKHVGPLTITGAAAELGQVTEVTLPAGGSIVAVPATATAVLIEPPRTNTYSISFVGNLLDAPNYIHKTAPFAFSFESAPVLGFVLTAPVKMRFTFI